VDLRTASATAALLLDSEREPSDADLDETGLMSDVLPDWTEEWVLVERERYHQLRLRALEALTEHLTARGMFGQAVQAGIAAVAGEPLRESAHRALIRAHVAAGNAAAALREYHEFRDLLLGELHLEPSPAMEALISGLTPQ
jgi:DNA-binding SARP family transcriptional activator